MPLIVAANRDEWLERPASPMEVLRRRNPRVLGGRDLLAGGTWMAVNRRGVVAALTNRPTAGGRDSAKRSRGALPLLLAQRGTAAEGAAALVQSVDPAEFNPCWILVGDRDSLFYLERSAGLPLRGEVSGTRAPHPREPILVGAIAQGGLGALCAPRSRAAHGGLAGPGVGARAPQQRDPPGCARGGRSGRSPVPPPRDFRSLRSCGSLRHPLVDDCPRPPCTPGPAKCPLHGRSALRLRVPRSDEALARLSRLSQLFACIRNAGPNIVGRG